ncbi:TPA: DUF3419 family protein, partial [Candidatus Poribacteria bacterium]|nr:DUF3419 family protein [Candidatus Poribacteria bacterium]
QVKDNHVQFAVVREDPKIEAELVCLHQVSEVLLIASGGCTALTLQALFPDLRLTLLDLNPAQLELIKKKRQALTDTNICPHAFNIGTSDSRGLNQCGNFESLFRGLREFIFDLVADEEQVRALFEERGGLKRATELLFSNRYWPVAFDLFFSDSLLNTMFGPNATQHAKPGSYPKYFQKLFEKGLMSDQAFDNYFLHHVFLGYYLDRPTSLPHYLTVSPPDYHFQMVEGTLDQVSDLGCFDLISLSNIMDWMSPADITTLLVKLQNQMKSGAIVLYRQLNNPIDLETEFGDSFQFDPALGNRLLEAERSLFYSSIHVGKKR